MDEHSRWSCKFGPMCLQFGPYGNGETLRKIRAIRAVSRPAGYSMRESQAGGQLEHRMLRRNRQQQQQQKQKQRQQTNTTTTTATTSTATTADNSLPQLMSKRRLLRTSKAVESSPFVNVTNIAPGFSSSALSRRETHRSPTAKHKKRYRVRSIKQPIFAGGRARQQLFPAPCSSIALTYVDLHHPRNVLARNIHTATFSSPDLCILYNRRT